VTLRWIEWTLYATLAVVLVYALRHYVFTLQRLFGRQRTPYLDIEEALWPPVTVLVPCHNEQSVIARCLESLLLLDYPSEKVAILPVDDRSTDATGEILRDFEARYPGRITPMYRTSGTPGKAAVLKDAMPRVKTDVIILFDADYLPNRGLLKRLVAPFFDPEVGAVMGRVVPANAGTNLLTRLLDLERSGGYQVDQQARMNLSLVPQFGGTVGGVRKSALERAGGWDVKTITEDTDATFKLLLSGWITAYENRAECYEEVPEDWISRQRQIRRWAFGHNQALVRYLRVVVGRDSRLGLMQRVDAALLLGIYALAPMIVLAWLLALALFYFDAAPSPGVFALLALSSYIALGNFAPFFEIAAAAHLDGTRERARLLPVVLLGFVVSCVAVTEAAFSALKPLRGKVPVWHKTRRARDAS
jgi:cellulose synthase/poly-beta-1,6-N-acetylglucosamine synthase-like glycosyltransferase